MPLRPCLRGLSGTGSLGGSLSLLRLPHALGSLRSALSSLRGALRGAASLFGSLQSLGNSLRSLGGSGGVVLLAAFRAASAPVLASSAFF